MDESILTSIKLALGIQEDYEYFDAQLIMHINSILAVLTQVGVGPSEGFSIGDSSETWGDFIGENVKLDYVKSYVYLRTKVLFDPPQSSVVMEAMKASIAELEWRGFVECDPVEGTI